MHVLLQAGRPCCDVLVISPVETFGHRSIPGGRHCLRQIHQRSKRSIKRIGMFHMACRSAGRFRLRRRGQPRRMGGLMPPSLFSARCTHRRYSWRAWRPCDPRRSACWAGFKRRAGVLFLPGVRRNSSMRIPAAAESSRQRHSATPFSRERLVQGGSRGGWCRLGTSCDERGARAVPSDA